MTKLAITLSFGPQRQRDYLSHTYAKYFEALGAVAVPVPNVLADPVAYVEALDLDGLILSGGGDIAPALYGADDTHCDEIAPPRDRTEWALLGWAVERQKPVMGICRGMQVINVYFGGALVQDIPALVSPAVPHADSTHPIALTHARLAETLGAPEIHVNSHHHQGMTAATLAPDLEKLAVSEEDGVIEALWHRALPVLGVQWHPERPSPSAHADRRLIGAWLDGSLWRLRG